MTAELSRSALPPLPTIVMVSLHTVSYTHLTLPTKA